MYGHYTARVVLPNDGHFGHFVAVSWICEIDISSNKVIWEASLLLTEILVGELKPRAIVVHHLKNRNVDHESIDPYLLFSDSEKKKGSTCERI